MKLEEMTMTLIFVCSLFQEILQNACRYGLYINNTPRLIEYFKKIKGENKIKFLEEIPNPK